MVGGDDEADAPLLNSDGDTFNWLAQTISIGSSGLASTFESLREGSLNYNDDGILQKLTEYIVFLANGGLGNRVSQEVA